MKNKCDKPMKIFSSLLFFWHVTKNIHTVGEHYFIPSIKSSDIIIEKHQNKKMKSKLYVPGVGEFI
jgi:hypothetical protein